MKKSEIAGYLLALIAFNLKLYHIHYHTWIILASILFLLALYFTLLIKKEIEKDSFFIGLSSVFFITWLLFLTKFFPLPTVPMALAISSLIVGLFFKIANKSTLADGRQWINLLIVILCFIVYRMPNEKRYYLTAIRFNYEIDSDYQTWVKYSWFLYQAEKYDEAFAASEKALYIANQMRDEFWVEKIIDQQEKMKDRSWNKY